jgi:hypothetical protein
MPSSVTAPEGQLSRRDKFRAYMQAFNPTAPAREVIEAGLVCEDLHQSLYRNLAARADLEPGCQQLLVGGVGSGKTTELILAERWLGMQPHVLPVYVDVSADTNLSSLNMGALIASFGMRLSFEVFASEAIWQDKEKAEELTKIDEKVMEFAYGKRIERPLNRLAALSSLSAAPTDEFQNGAFVNTETVPGKLIPPFPALDRDIREMRGFISELLAAVKETKKEVVVVFDGLDRLLDPNKFWSIVYQDLRLLRELKVSVIATAPLSVLFGVGVGQSISDHFDRVHHLTVIPNDSAVTSLELVLERRGVTNLLDPGIAYFICNYSGGVLRDLISVARDAAEEAYVSDHDYISVGDIEKVGHQLGIGYLRGLGPEAINRLLRLESSKSFDLGQPSNLELLVTRRVLEYSSTDFRVHPALLSVIPRPESQRA